jgi:hypothetical protein
MAKNENVSSIDRKGKPAGNGRETKPCWKQRAWQARSTI